MIALAQPSLANLPPEDSTLAQQVIQSPIVLTGRGGSGTRMLSLLANAADIFIGNEVNASGDSIEWADLLYKYSIKKLENDLLNQAYHDDELHKELLGHARYYLDQGNWDGIQPWGWKLPETMFLIPQIASVFKDSIFIHLVRHPISSSIRRTHKTSRKSSPIGLAALRSAYQFAGRDLDKIGSDDDYLRNALTWQHQVAGISIFARDHLPKHRYLEVRYEDLCNRPNETRQNFLKYLGLPPDTRVSDIETIDIDSTRCNAESYSDYRAKEVWDLCSETALQLGYNESGVANDLV